MDCLLTTDRALPPPLNKKLWYATDQHVEFVDRFEFRGRRQLILVVPPGLTIDAFTNVFDVTAAKKWEIPDRLHSQRRELNVTKRGQIAPCCLLPGNTQQIAVEAS
jgi:hypothetical protein